MEKISQYLLSALHPALPGIKMQQSNWTTTSGAHKGSSGHLRMVQLEFLLDGH